MQTKHGPKVLQKLQKQHPHIFSANPVLSAPHQYKGSSEFVVELGSCGNGQQAKYVSKTKPTFQEGAFGKLNANSENFVMQADFKPSQEWQNRM